MTQTAYAPVQKLNRNHKLSLDALQSRRRIRALNDELSQLRGSYAGLVGDILDHDIEYGEILEIRNDYLKKIQSSPLKKYEDAVSRLELYRRLTKKYHDRFLSSQIIYAGHEGIAPLRATENLIASITYRLIDLSNTDKNSFVCTMKRVREIQSALKASHV